MLKKYLCLALCIFMMLGIAVPALAVSGAPNLSATNIKFSATSNGAALLKFPAGGSDVYASSKVTNNGDESDSAVLWIGVYKDGVMVDIDYCRRDIPAGLTYYFETPAVTLPADATSSNTEVVAYLWDSFKGANAITRSATLLKDGKEKDLIRDISINGQVIEDFSNDKTSYTYNITKDDSRPEITVRPVDNATKIEISDFSIPGSARITATASDGTKKVFSIDFAMSLGNVTNIRTRYVSGGSASGVPVESDKMVAVPSKALPLADFLSPSHPFQTAATDAEKLALIQGSANLFNTTDKGYWMFGDRDPRKDGVEWFLNEGPSNEPTSPVLIGSNVTRVLALNNEKDLTDAIDDVYSFNIDKPATIYVGMLWHAQDEGVEATDTNFVTKNGWTKAYGEYWFYKSLGTTVSVGGSSYTVPKGKGSKYDKFYTKRYDEPGLVQIPSRGGSCGSGGYVIFVVWDPDPADSNANVASATYKFPGGEATAIADFADDNYIEIPAGASETDVPIIDVVLEDDRASVKVVYPETIPGMALVTVTAFNGTKKDYKVHITAQPGVSTDATLSELKYNDTAIELKAGEEIYDVILPHDTTEAPVVTATASDAGANVAITQSEIEGKNISSAEVDVTAADGETTKTYIVNFTVLDPPASSDATLSDLKVNGEAVLGFAADVYEYDVELPYGTTEAPVVSATPSDAKATVAITQPTYTDGTVSDAVVKVTAEDGTEREYIIHLSISTVEQGVDARLSSITINGNLLDEFDSEDFDYEVVLPPTVINAPVVGATAVDGNATVAITQPVYDEGTVSDAVIEVTSANGTFEHTYTISFTIDERRITNIKTRYDSGSANADAGEPIEDTRLEAVDGSETVAPTNFFDMDAFNNATNEEKIAMISNADLNTYWTENRKAWIYGDRKPTSNTKGANLEWVILEGTSEELLGDDVHKVLTIKDDGKFQGGAVPDLYTFEINAPATVYTVMIGASIPADAVDVNYEAEGWTAESGLKVTRGVVDKVADNAELNDYRFPKGTGSTYEKAFSKHFNAGLVEIPSRGDTGIIYAGGIMIFVKWEDAVISDDATLADLTLNGESIEGFDPEVYDYNITLPSDTVALPLVGATANDVNSTVAITQPEIDGDSISDAVIVVTASDGEAELTYTISFEIEQGPVNPVGEVTNIKTRYGSSSGEPEENSSKMWAVQGSSAAPVTVFADLYATDEEKVAATKDPATNPYNTDDETKWIFGDRKPNGYAKWQTVKYTDLEWVVVEGTSEIFLGENVTKVLTQNNEKNYADTVEDVYTFDISKPATVYVVHLGTHANIESNYTAYNWKKENDLELHRGMVTTVTVQEDVDGELVDVTYNVPAGEQDAYKTIYSKYYEAGNVKIPSRGGKTGTGMTIFVVWGEQEEPLSDDATLSDLTVDGTTVDGFAADDYEYEVTLPVGTTEAPVVAATANDENATVDITQPVIDGDSVSDAVIVVTAEDGETELTYTISFTIEAGPVNPVGEVLNLKSRYKSGEPNKDTGTPQEDSKLEVVESLAVPAVNFTDPDHPFNDASDEDKLKMLRNEAPYDNPPSNPGFTDDPRYWMYCDRSMTQADGGEVQWALLGGEGNTSPIFYSENVTRIVTRKAEGNFEGGSVDDLYTFEITKPATIYAFPCGNIDDLSITHTNFVDNNGWEQATGLKLNKPTLTTVKVFEGTENEESIKVPNGGASNYANGYYKYFEEGEVNIPSRGGTSGAGGTVIFIVWGEQEEPLSDDATLSDIKVNGNSINLVEEVSNYSVTLEEEVAEVTATPNFADADVDISEVNFVDGQATVVINVTAEDGVTTKVYKVNLGVGLITELSNAVGNLSVGYNLECDGESTDYTALAYSDRNNVFYVANSSASFNGASYILTRKDDAREDAYKSDTKTVWTTFKVANDCVVYYAFSQSDVDWHGMEDGWIKIDKVVNVQGGFNTTNVYAKAYSAGETVEVPNAGVGTNDWNANTIIIDWDDEDPTLPSDDATLSDLTVDGTTVDGFAADDYEYEVTLPVGTTEAPVVAATANDENATVDITQPVIDGDSVSDAVIVVTAEDGETELTYTISFTIEQEPSLGNDATLASLTVKGEEVDLTAEPYAVILPYDTTEIVEADVLVTKTDENATYEITEYPVIEEGNVTGALVIEVTAEDGETTKTYTITVTLEAPSDDATLSALMVNGSGVDGFSPTSYTYNVTLPYGTTMAPVVHVRLSDENATVDYVGDKPAITEGNVSDAVIRVTAEDGSTQDYTISFEIDSEVPASLPGEVVEGSVKTRYAGGSTAAPEPVVDEKVFAVQGSYAAPATDFTTMFSDPAKQVAEAENELLNPYFTEDHRFWIFGDKRLNTLSNVDWAMVEGLSEELTGHNVTKILTLNNEKSIDDAIDDIYSFEITKPATVYTILMWHAQDSVELTDANFVTKNGWTKAYGEGIEFCRGKKAAVGDVNVPAGVSSAYNKTYVKHFDVGPVEIPSRGGFTHSGGMAVFIVWDEDAPTASDDATLSDLTVDGTTVDGFAADDYEYEVTLPVGTTEAPVVAATANDENATVDITQPVIDGDSVSDAVIVVTAEDGETELTYTISFTIEQEPSLGDDATLASLTVKGEEVDLTAEPYAVILPYDTTEIVEADVLVTKTDENATYEITEYPVIEEGNVTGALVIEVTAEDGETTKTYTITVTLTEDPAKLADATLSDIKVDEVTISGFNANIRHYSISVAAGTTEIPEVTATANYAGADVQIDEGTMDGGLGTTVITVTSADESVTNVYYVNFGDESLVTDLVHKTGTVKVGYNLICDGTEDVNGPTLAYSDRDNIFYSLSTSAAFNGATFIMPRKSLSSNDGSASTEPALDNEWVKFNVGRNCDVYYVSPAIKYSNDPWTRGEDQGWVYVDGLKARVASSFGASTNIYKKEYTAGSEVKVPNLGLVSAAGGTGTIIIIWKEDAPTASDDATLSDLTVDGTTVDGFAADDYEYEVTLPVGTTEAPVVAATANDENATVDITQPVIDGDSVSDAVIVVTAEDGETELTYTISFTIEQEPSLGDDATISALMVNSKPVVGFASDVYTYNVTLIAGTTEVPAVFVTLSDPNATASLENPLAVTEGTVNDAIINVTAADGETKQTYTISFEIEAGPPVHGTVTNVMTRFDGGAIPADESYEKEDWVFAVQGSFVSPVTVFSEVFATEEKQIAEAGNELLNPYYTKNRGYWMFSDNYPSRYSDGSYIDWGLCEGTSPVLLGENVTKIITRNAEKALNDAIEDVYSFDIDKSATVYVISLGAPGGGNSVMQANFEEYGWTLDTTGITMVRNKKETKTVDSVNYGIPNGAGSPYSSNRVFYKHYDAESTVKVPSRGGATQSGGMAIFVVWD